MSKESYTHKHDTTNSHEDARFNKRQLVALAASIAVSLAAGGAKGYEWLTDKERIATDTYTYSPTPGGDIDQLSDNTDSLIERNNLGVNLSSVRGIVYEGQTIQREVEHAEDTSVTIELYKDRLGTVSVKATPTSLLESSDK